MNTARVVRENENSSSTRKLVGSEQRLPRMKKALGDVQNTLHSRPVNFVNPNANSGVKAPDKSSALSKTIGDGHSLSKKTTTSGKAVNVTPIKSARKLLLSTPNADNEIFETHNHLLCEQDDQSYINDVLKEYKFTNNQINRLVKSVKTFVTPYSHHYYAPYEDEEIEIPILKFEENIFSVSDIMSDLINPQVPPLFEVQ